VAVKVGDKVRVVRSERWGWEAGVGAEGVVVPTDDLEEMLTPITVRLTKFAREVDRDISDEEMYGYYEDELVVLEPA
jgi:hypothetical protein